MAKDFKHNPDTRFRAIGNLDKTEARAEAEALRDAIEYHDHLYYVENRPRIADATYDKLFRRLRELESAFPDLRVPDSPTQRVGAEPVSSLSKVRHAAPMLSLNAVLERGEVDNFDRFLRRQADRKSVHYVVEPKFDGLSVEMVYENGHFAYGATRGNGEVGEDITHNLTTIRALPMRLRGDDIPPRIALRAEVFLYRKGFTDLNRRRVERGDEPFANPRNAAAGIMRQLDPRKAADKPFGLFFYGIIATEGEWPDSHARALQRLKDWGLPVCDEMKRVSSIEGIARFHRRLADRRDELDYEIDGIVIKADDYELHRRLGARERSPRWALAWKFEPKEEITRVEDITVQVGRTGKLTPVALLRPVDVGGVTVSRATLHNEEEVHRKDIRVGDEVRIIRAGDVIPEVEARIEHRGRKRSRPFAMPERCPSCGTEVVRRGAYTVCPAGIGCPAQLVGHITHYASRDALDIDLLGVQTARQLVERDLVHDLADLYELKVEQLEKLDGFARKSARKLYDSIRATRQPRLDKFLYALGVPQVGARTAKVLARSMSSLEAIESASADELSAVPDVGSVAGQSIADFFGNRTNRDVLRRMRRAGMRAQSMSRPRAQPLRDKVFVFTGSLEHFRREEAKDIVERLGGRATGSVSDNTDYVVVGKRPGSKYDEAQRRHIQRLNEEEFARLVKQ